MSDDWEFSRTLTATLPIVCLILSPKHRIRRRVSSSAQGEELGVSGMGPGFSMYPLAGAISPISAPPRTESGSTKTRTRVPSDQRNSLIANSNRATLSVNSPCFTARYTTFSAALAQFGRITMDTSRNRQKYRGTRRFIRKTVRALSNPCTDKRGRRPSTLALQGRDFSRLTNGIDAGRRLNQHTDPRTREHLARAALLMNTRNQSLNPTDPRSRLSAFGLLSPSLIISLTSLVESA